MNLYVYSKVELTVSPQKSIRRADHRKGNIYIFSNIIFSTFVGGRGREKENLKKIEGGANFLYRHFLGRVVVPSP